MEILKISSRRTVFTVFAILCFGHWVLGQPVTSGIPPSFRSTSTMVSVPEVVLPQLDISRVLAEDQSHSYNNRFTAPIKVNYSLQDAGEWTTLENGDRIWRLKITSPGAYAVAFLYDGFYLPHGAQLYMYSADHRQVLGAYTAANNPRSGRFMTGLIYGQSAVLEYYEPAVVSGLGNFHLFRVDHAYNANRLVDADPAAKSLLAFGFESSFPCHINVNCTQGNNWPDQKRGICRIILVVEEGMGYCTGNLMNNTANDGKPYILGAFHCQDGYTPLFDLWRFDFNYQGANCPNPATEPGYDSVLGCELRAGRQANDFILVELTNPIPLAYNVFFNGWNRAGTNVSTPFLMHHPRGDIKKISGSSNTATIFNAPIDWDNGVTTPASHHYRLVFTYGAFEVGSSGGALFDNMGRVVAQLHGGFSDCTSSTAYFGRFSLSWDGGGAPNNRLKDWLDPLNQAPVTLNGINQPEPSEATVSGIVKTEALGLIAGATVTLIGPTDTLSMVTGVDGAFAFEHLPTGIEYSLKASKTINVKNGVSTQDLIQIRRHILGTALLDSPYKYVAADVNGSKTVTTADLILIQKVILSISSQFDAVDSWQFLPASMILPTNPFTVTLPFEGISFTLEQNLEKDFVGIKSGDANVSADPAL